MQADGFLVIRKPDLLAGLIAPWPLGESHSEVMIELKLAGNHLDRSAVERALLRRQARQVQRLEDDDPTWLGEEPLWLVASHLPDWLDRMCQPERFAPGCYWVERHRERFVWIAANELPLDDDLIPFLLARSGQALDDFSNWVAPRRPLDWVMTMLEYLPMSMPTREELMRRFAPVDDPEIMARRKHILQVLLDMDPQMQQQLIDVGMKKGLDMGLEQGIEKGLERGLEKGRELGMETGVLKGQLTEARAALRRVLARRGLAPSQADHVRIDACADLATLERWHDRAVTATRVVDVLE
ncbi:MAG TPA: hypothetical protein VHW23_21530 [Kofleriaceae bacterium]|nr:hypothetical protein [Kofleriaceae bacterium]